MDQGWRRFSRARAVRQSATARRSAGRREPLNPRAPSAPYAHIANQQRPLVGAASTGPGRDKSNHYEVATGPSSVRTDTRAVAYSSAARMDALRAPGLPRGQKGRRIEDGRRGPSRDFLWKEIGPDEVVAATSRCGAPLLYQKPRARRSRMPLAMTIRAAPVSAAMAIHRLSQPGNTNSRAASLTASEKPMFWRMIPRARRPKRMA